MFTFVLGNSIAANGYWAGFVAEALLLDTENPGRMFSHSVPSEATPNGVWLALLKVSVNTFLTDESDEENRPIMPSLQSGPKGSMIF